MNDPETELEIAVRLLQEARKYLNLMEWSEEVDQFLKRNK